MLDIEKMKIGSMADLKIGLSTRSIYKCSKDIFEINDTSDGWVTATVNKATLNDLLDGKIGLLDLDWK